LTERAYKDVIESGKYSYQKFISDFDEFLSTRVRCRSKVVLLTGVTAAYNPVLNRLTLLHYEIKSMSGFASYPSTVPLPPEQAAALPPDEVTGIVINNMLYDINLIPVLRSIKILIRKQLKRAPFLDRIVQYLYRRIN